MNRATSNRTLTRNQLHNALALARLQPADNSPLQGLFEGPAPTLNKSDWQTLWDLNWLENPAAPRLTGAARETLAALCQPRASAELLLGTGDSLFQASFYSAGRFAEHELVSLVSDPQKQAFGFLGGQSPATLADLLLAQLLVGELDTAVTLRAELSPAAFVALLTILDLQLANVLRARLEREREPAPSFRPAALWQMLVEGQLAGDLNWTVSLMQLLLPQVDYALDEEALQHGLAALVAENLVLPAGAGCSTPADPLLELADGLHPLLSFARLSVNIQDDGRPQRRDELVFVRGRTATLLVQPVTARDGRQLLLVDNLDGVELGELLFSIGLPDQRVVGAPRRPDERQLQPAASSAGWQLKIAPGMAAAGPSYPLGDHVTLGREKSCNICLQDELISRRHAVIEWAGTAFRISDLNSSNGTFVNGQRVQRALQLEDGDSIQLGRMRLVIEGPQHIPTSGACGTSGTCGTCSTCGTSGTCSTCGTSGTCSTCGAVTNSGRAFCTQCGHPLPDANQS